MREFISRVIFVIVDTLIIALSIYLAYKIKVFVDSSSIKPIAIEEYLKLYTLYIIPITLFFYEGIYRYRYDFWHESRLIFKGVIFSMLLTFAYLAVTKSIDSYSRIIIALTFLFIAILIPIIKLILKNLLFKFKVWQKEVEVFDNDPFLISEIYGNHYLGYVKRSENCSFVDTIFINPKKFSKEEINRKIIDEIKVKKEVIFIPIIDGYDLTHCEIYQIFNTRTNLIVLENRLKSIPNRVLKIFSDTILALLLIVIFIPLIIIISVLIKIFESNSSIIFKQKRVGESGREFYCYKFRTMVEDGEELLNSYLKEHPEEIEYFKRYHKYKRDPRVTKVGRWLRAFSLDEIPQIFNVLRLEMSIIGPRPYLVEERDMLKGYEDLILSVKPGITGLWQVNGRSNLTFDERVELESWYIKNWTLWLDFVILLKTIKSVIGRVGAK